MCKKERSHKKRGRTTKKTHQDLILLKRIWNRPFFKTPNHTYIRFNFICSESCVFFLLFNRPCVCFSLFFHKKTHAHEGNTQMRKAGDCSMHHLRKKGSFRMCVRIELCMKSSIVVPLYAAVAVHNHSIFGNATREFSEGGNQNVYKLLNLMRFSRVTHFSICTKRMPNVRLVGSCFFSVVLFKLSSKLF